VVVEKIFENMNTAEWVLNFVFQSMIVLFGGWLLVRLFKHKAAPLRSKISLMTMLALLLLPFFSGMYHSLDITLYETSLPFAGNSKLDFFESRENGTIGINTGQEKRRAHSSIFNTFMPSIMTVYIINGLGMVWFTGFMILFCRLLYGAFSLRGFKKRLVRINDNRLENVLKQAQKTFGFKPLPEVYTLSSAKSPVVLGIIRPLIVLPRDLYDKLDNNEIKGILFHELSHIYHKDQVTGILQRIVTAFQWWNPLIYALSADFSKAREEISDNYAIMENSSREYAESLINLAEKTSLISRLPFTQGMAIPHIPLKDRISQILSKERIMETETKKSTTFLLLLVSLLLIGLITGHKWTFAAEKSEVKEKSASGISLSDEDQKKKGQKEEKPIHVDKKKAKLIKKVEPEYPEEAKKEGIQGVVIIEGTTDKKGNVAKVKVLKGEHKILNEAAIKAVKQWKYKLPIIKGKPMAITFTVTIRFRPKDEEKKEKTKGKKEVKDVLQSAIL